MSSLIMSVLCLFTFYMLLVRSYFLRSNRFNSVLSYILKASFVLFPSIFKVMIFIIATRCVFAMLTANIPIFLVPNMFYSYVVFVAFRFWLPILMFSLVTAPSTFFSHLVPYGTPSTLIFFLPVIEIFSQLIRPFTLTIRFATNLSAGHIIMFMFSYFSLLSPVLYPVIHIVLVVLFIIEIFIAFLQSYIFVTLLRLYLSETV